MDKAEFKQRYFEFLEKEKLKPEEALVGSGGTLLMYGLRKETQDIDMDLDRKKFLEFKKRGYKTHIFNDTVLVIEYDSFIDIHEREVTDYVLVEGVGSWSLQSVLDLKMKLNREKDQADIKNIKEYMKRHKDIKPIKLPSTLKHW